MAETKQNAFEILNAVNVNEHTEVKDTGKAKLTYLSWAWAWAEVKKRFPNASYEIIKFDGLPYVFDAKTGYMVYTTVTIEGITHEMWLPVMDSNNRAMLDHVYEVKTNYKTFTVQPATMFDINKTIMRCLTKNLAMFGLGLYIYSGEDLPEESDETISNEAQPAKKAAPKRAAAAKAAPKVAPEPPPEDPNNGLPFEIDTTVTNRDKFRNYIVKNNITKKIITQTINECGLTDSSPDDEWEKGLMYLIALTGGVEQ